MEETAASQPGYECCTFRGSLNALDVKTGAVVWKTFMVPQAQAAGKNAAGVALWGPSGVGIWSAPTIDVKRGLVYAGTGNTYSAPAQPTADAIVAFDLKSGAIKMDQAADRRRRLRLPRRQRQLRREGRARLRSRHAADADHACPTAAT